MTESPNSLGDERTQAGLPPEPSIARSLGDQSTQAEGVSSVSDLGALAANLDETLELTDLAARYEIGEVIGRGGMGEVLKARDKRLERPVAIKRILGEGARSATALRRFLTEARSLARLNHFNVVQVYDYGRDREGPFLILEYVAGKSLQDRLKAGPLPLEQAVDLTCQLCDGLGAAHKQGIIHRDVKPANVLLTEEGEPKLTDFGLAHRETNDDGRTQAGAVLGTIDFMPPEQRRDATQADARSDLWSLAATLYQMLTGKTPKVIRLDLVPDALRSALGKALEEEPAQRYETAAVFKEALRSAAEQLRRATARSKQTRLVEGVCPQCGIENDQGRKFCKSCRAALRVDCLNCRTTIKVWEDVCGECGTSQKEEAEQIRIACARQLDEADSLGREYRFEEALQLCAAVRNEKPTFLADLKQRAGELTKDLQARRAEQTRVAAELFDDARKHFEAAHYEAALTELSKIPEPLCDAGAQKLKDECRKQIVEVMSLLSEINRRIAAKELVGLEEVTARFLKLKKDHEQVAALHRKLMEQAGEQGKSIADKVAAGKGPKELRENCPSCRNGLQITAATEGKSFRCPFCQTLLRVSGDLRTLTTVDPSSEKNDTSGTYRMAETPAPRSDESSSKIISQPPPPTLIAPSDPAPIAQPQSSGGRRRVSYKLLAVCAAGAAAIGLVIVVYLVTNHGTIRIELSDPQAMVTLKIDGEKVTFENRTTPLTLSAGVHGLEVASPQFETVAKQFTVLRGANKPIQVTLLPKDRSVDSTASPVTVDRLIRPMPQAVYTLHVDPPTASIDVSGIDAYVSGNGAHRRVTVNSPDGVTALVVAASAPGCAPFQRTVVPKSQDRQNLDFQLKPQIVTSNQEPKRVVLVVHPEITIAIGGDQKIHENNWLDSEATLSPPAGVQLSEISLKANYGDGSRVRSLTTDSAGGFRLRHRYPKAGRYSVIVVATVGDKAAGESVLQVDVEKRLPLPDEVSARRSRRQVRDLLPEKFTAAVKPADKIALCTEILALAERSKTDPPAFFGLCAEAHDLAVAAADVDNLEYCIRQTSELYELSFYDAVNTSLLKLLSSQRFPSVLHKIGDKAVALAADAAYYEQFDSAGKLVETAHQAAAKSADLKLKKSANLAVESLKSIQVAWQAASQAEATLTTKPDDAQACLQVGLYLAFYRQDWEQGLPLLSIASDMGLKDLAVLERSNPNEPITQLKIADGWWELAEKSDTVAAKSLKQRAALWYTKCRASMTGISQKRIDQRLGTLGTKDPTSASVKVTKAVYIADEIAKAVFRTDPEGKTITRIAETNAVRGLAVDSTNKKLYWVNHNLGEIVRAELDGTNATTIVKGQTNQTSGIAVDPKRGKLYWYSRGGIYRSDLDGSNSDEFISAQLTGAPCFQAVGVDANAGTLFWISVSGRREVLYSARLDESKPQPNRIADVGPETAGTYLALDTVSRTVYVTLSEHVFSICSVNYDGTGLNTLLTLPAGQQPNGIAVDEVNRRLIWGVIDGANRLEMMNLDGTDRRPMESAGVSRLPRGIDVLYEESLAVVRSQVEPIPAELSKVEVHQNSPSGKTSEAESAAFAFFAFDDRARMLTPLVQVLPVTLEAWVRVREAPPSGETNPLNNCRYIFGSDLPGKQASGLGLQYIGNNPQPKRLIAEVFPPAPHIHGSTAVPQMNKWVHLAVVFGKKNTVVFLDGQPVLNARASQSPNSSPFVIGHVGLENTMNAYFQGDMREIRISGGERYREAFRTITSLDSDANTLALYRADSVRNGLAQDLSGSGNHATLEGVIVKREAPHDTR